MKNLIVSICIIWVFLTLATDGKLHCKSPNADIPQDWITMADPCTKIMIEQIQEELTAAMTYLALGAHFSRDTINRPGLAEFFFKNAHEERDHAIKLIDYLLMRGKLTQDVHKLIRNPMPVETKWENAFKALNEALMLETRVTEKIRGIISICESPSTSLNDYHLVDYLSGEFLEEQHKGQRTLAGMASVLGKMVEHHGVIGEFLFDKKLQNNDFVF